MLTCLQWEGRTENADCELIDNLSRDVGANRIATTEISRRGKVEQTGRLGNCAVRFLTQRRPLVVHAFSLNLADSALAYVETLDDEVTGLSHAHLVILGVHQGQENLFAPIFRKLFEFFFLDHETPSLGTDTLIAMDDTLECWVATSPPWPVRMLTSRPGHEQLAVQIIAHRDGRF